MRAGSGWFGLRALPPGAGVGVSRVSVTSSTCRSVRHAPRDAPEAPARSRRCLAGPEGLEPQPPVLETGTLPIELRPFGGAEPACTRRRDPVSGRAGARGFEPPKGRVYAQGTAPVEPRGAPDAPPWTPGGVGAWSHD